MISLNTPRLEDQWLDLKQAQEIRLDSLEHKFQVREATRKLFFSILVHEP